MRPFLALTVCLLLIAGCGPTVSKEDLGTILDEVPKVPGTEKPYEIPELDPPPGEEAEPAEGSEVDDSQ